MTRIMRRMYNIVPHDPENGTFGDCHRNCIAMLLGMDQNDVPHFYNDDNPEGKRDIERFLASKGFAYGDCIYDADSLTLDQILDYTSRMMTNIPLILGGESRKGINHSVVVLNGKIWCDPSGSGIIGPMISSNPAERYYWITFISPIPDIIVEVEPEPIERNDNVG